MISEHKHRQRVLKVITEKQLSSVMNNTKWRDLQAAVLDNLPFPPPYQAKYVLEEKLYPEDFERDVWYHGDWIEGLMPFYGVEWIRVRPRYTKHRGRLVEPETMDCTEEFVTLLKKLNIPFRQEIDSVYIYGYTADTGMFLK